MVKLVGDLLRNDSKSVETDYERKANEGCEHQDGKTQEIPGQGESQSWKAESQ